MNSPLQLPRPVGSSFGEGVPICTLAASNSEGGLRSSARHGCKSERKKVYRKIEAEAFA
jgi:hypothetical protein